MSYTANLAGTRPLLADACDARGVVFGVGSLDVGAAIPCPTICPFGQLPAAELGHAGAMRIRSAAATHRRVASTCKYGSRKPRWTVRGPTRFIPSDRGTGSLTKRICALTSERWQCLCS